MEKLIAIRADGDSEIGFGHLVRTQALARQLEKAGTRVVFITRNPENLRAGQVISLTNEVGRDEDTVVEDIIRRIRPDMLIIDSYLYDQKRLDLVSRLDPVTVYIDDLNQCIFNTTYVINGNIYAEDLNYRGSAKFLLGPRYAMLREEFQDLPTRRTRLEVRNVLITMGAADIRSVTLPLIEMLQDYPLFEQICWHAVIGPAFKNRSVVEDLLSRHSNVLVYNDPDIKKLMECSDFCLSAAGSTLYELAACGVPTISIVMADNQIRLAKEAMKRGFAANLGWYDHFTSQELFNALGRLASDHDTRNDMSRRGQEAIDGNGAARAVRALLLGFDMDVNETH